MEKKVMSDYSCYCTEAQSKKALELGAPINTRWGYNGYPPMPFVKEIVIEHRHYAEIPTAEQMLGWIEEQGLQIIVSVNVFDQWCANVHIQGWSKTIFTTDLVGTRQEATLAAIDAVLESEDLTSVFNQQTE